MFAEREEGGGRNEDTEKKNILAEFISFNTRTVSLVSLLVVFTQESKRDIVDYINTQLINSYPTINQPLQNGSNQEENGSLED